MAYRKTFATPLSVIRTGAVAVSAESQSPRDAIGRRLPHPALEPIIESGIVRTRRLDGPISMQCNDDTFTTTCTAQPAGVRFRD